MMLYYVYSPFNCGDDVNSHFNVGYEVNSPFNDDKYCQQSFNGGNDVHSFLVMVYDV